MNVSHSAPGPGRRLGWALPMMAVAGFWAAFNIAMLVSGANPIQSGALIDTDSHMKLVRIEQLLRTGAWFDGSIERNNAPFGDVLHWTRLFDLVVVALAAPLFFIADLKRALYLAGLAVSPLLQLGLGFALLWMLRPFAARYGKPAIVLAVLLTLFQVGITGYSLAGRADHHVMLMILFALAFGAFARMLAPSAEGRKLWGPEILAGLLCALGLWASVELLPAAATGAAAGGLIWVLNGAEFESRNRRFALAFVAFSAAALAIERPPSQYFSAEYDRISIAQLAAAGAVATTWLLIAAARRWLRSGETRRQRLAIAIAAAAISGAALFVLFPTLLAGPSAAFDPAIRAIWLDQVSEMQPLWPNTPARAAKFFAHCGTALIAAPVIAYGLVRRDRRDEWRIWLLFGIGLVTVFPIALAHVRYSAYCEILAAPGLVLVVYGVVAWSEPMRVMILRVLIRVGAIGGLFFAPIGAAAALHPAPPPNGPKTALSALEACSLRKFIPALTGPESPWRDRSMTILTHIDVGPELLYRTPHRIVGSPYHRNTAGIVDTIAAFGGSADRALEIVRKRRIEAILICRSAPDMSKLVIPGSGSLLERLTKNDPPAWLKPMPLPKDMDAHFQLFGVELP